MSRVCVLLGIALVLTGCGGPAKPFVSGDVTWEGSPLDDGYISFIPKDVNNEGASRPEGTAIVKGRFKLPAFPGSYRVEITANKEGPYDNVIKSRTFEQFLPNKYNAETTLFADVGSTGGNNLKFDLRGDARPPVETPSKTVEAPPPVTKEPPTKTTVPTPAPAPVPGPTPAPTPPSPLPVPMPRVDYPSIGPVVLMCYAMALVILIVEVVGALGLLVSMGSRAGKSKFTHAGQESKLTVEQQVEQAIARSATVVWARLARLALLVVGALVFLAILGAAEMIRYSARMEQRMDYLSRTR